MINVIVLMSTYNGEKYLEEQLDSILAQKGDFALQIAVRDDGSTDSTCEILNSYKNTGKLHWYAGNNLGPARSFIDLAFSCGDYDFYAFADQDDIWYSNKIEIGISRICEECKPALYFSNARLIDSGGKDLGRNVYNATPRTDFQSLSCAGGILGCTMIINNELMKTVRKDKPQKLIMHDFYIALVCAAVGGNIIYSTNAFMGYRQHEKNVVGVTYGLIRKIKSRLLSVITKAPTSIAEQAEEILNIYEDNLNIEYIEWINIVANYRNTIRNRILLAASREIKYINANMGLKNRMAILFANR